MGTLIKQIAAETLHVQIGKVFHLMLTYSLLPAATGDDVKVVQEMMCHAKIRRMVEAFAQAGME